MPKRSRTQRRANNSPQRNSERKGMIKPSSYDLEGKDYFALRSAIWQEQWKSIQDLIRTAPQLRRTLTKRDLISFSREIPVTRAITKIASGVARMKFLVKPPEDEEDPDSPQVKETIRKITYSLERPNRGLRHKSYLTLVQAMVQDVLMFGESVGEHKPPSPKEKDRDRRLFKMWLLDYTLLNVNRRWDEEDEDKPVAWFYPHASATQMQDVVPFYRDEIFYLTADTSSYYTDSQHQDPDSALKIAYAVVEEWIKLLRQKSLIVENTSTKTIVSLKDSTPESALDTYYKFQEQKNDSENNVRFLSGDASVLNITSRSDAELYPQYTEFLMSLIAICFNLSRRSLNLKEQDNYSVAEISTEADFQDAILPIALLVMEAINEVVDQYAPGYSVVLADMEPRKEGDESATATSLFREGINTLNEAREKIGDKPVENGDYFSDGRKVGEPPPKPDQGMGGYGGYGGEPPMEPMEEEESPSKTVPSDSGEEEDNGFDW